MDSRLRDFTRMNPHVYTRCKIAEHLEEECREVMLHDSMDLSRLMVHVHQVEESRKRKHTRAGESSLFKGRYDRDFEPKVKRNSEVDTPQERPPCRKSDKLHGGECMMGSNACYSCGKQGHMMKDCSNKRGQENKKEKVQPNSPSEEAPRRQRFFALKSRGAREGTSGDFSGA
ncbi:uncharacterized protein [Solanum lycopersicum]|uniref:uncharacterized protein n=1 Tax=Solanum lycopersicum TaxID=4081 RepID=UPI003748D9EF